MTGYQIYCNDSACVKGAIDSTVESMSSKLEHHNIEGQRITADHLSEEVFVAWNDLEIQHCDNVLRGALKRYFGGKEWHFQHCLILEYIPILPNSRIRYIMV